MRSFIDAAKSAGLVWLFTTVGLWIPGLLGWINEVTEWANQKGAPPFPDASNLAFLFVAALTAAFPAAVAGIVRYIENLSGKALLPRTSSVPVKASPNGEGGQTNAFYILAVVLLILLILVLFFGWR